MEGKVGGDAGALVALDPALGVDAEAFVRAWLDDGEAQGIGSDVSVATVPPGAFLPGAVELVAIPLVVGVASSALYDLLKRVARAARHDRPPADPPDLEVIDVDREGRRVLVVRIKARHQ